MYVFIYLFICFICPATYPSITLSPHRYSDKVAVAAGQRTGLIKLICIESPDLLSSCYKDLLHFHSSSDLQQSSLEPLSPDPVQSSRQSSLYLF